VEERERERERSSDYGYRIVVCVCVWSFHDDVMETNQQTESRKRIK